MEALNRTLSISGRPGELNVFIEPFLFTAPADAILEVREPKSWLVGRIWLHLQWQTNRRAPRRSQVIQVCRSHKIGLLASCGREMLTSRQSRPRSELRNQMPACSQLSRLSEGRKSVCGDEINQQCKVSWSLSLSQITYLYYAVLPTTVIKLQKCWFFALNEVQSEAEKQYKTREWSRGKKEPANRENI